MHNRYYAPRLAHFLTPDFRLPSILDPTTFKEPYAYATGNPISYWDPTGLEWWVFTDSQTGENSIFWLENEDVDDFLKIMVPVLEKLGSFEFIGTSSDLFHWGGLSDEQILSFSTNAFLEESSEESFYSLKRFEIQAINPSLCMGCDPEDLIINKKEVFLGFYSNAGLLDSDQFFFLDIIYSIAKLGVFAGEVGARAFLKSAARVVPIKVSGALAKTRLFSLLFRLSFRDAFVKHAMNPHTGMIYGITFDTIETFLSRVRAIISQRGLKPADFGLRTIAEDPVMHALWQESLKRSQKLKGYRLYLEALERGDEITQKMASNAWAAVRGKMSEVAEGKIKKGVEIHHWNFRKGDFPHLVVDPRNLVITVNRDQHDLIHILTSSSPTNRFNARINSLHELPIDYNYYPLAPRDALE